MDEWPPKWTRNFKDLFLLCVQELNGFIFASLLLIIEEGEKKNETEVSLETLIQKHKI